MRDYFNSSEMCSHVIIEACEAYITKMLESNALTDKERNELKLALKHIHEFSLLIYTRFGQDYSKRVIRYLGDNEVRLVGKYSKFKDCIAYIDTDEIGEIVKNDMFDCFECDKCDWQNCRTYKVAAACHIDGTNKNKGCPYKG